MIEINNLTTTSVDENFFKKIAKKILKEEFASWQEKEVDLSIVLAGPGRMKKLNKQYRRKNRVADVLAFPEQISKKEKFILPTKIEKTKGLGEIVICLSEVKKNTKRYKVTFQKELARVLIHGILHLLGYNHKRSKKEAEKMEKKQKHYLELLKIY